MEYNLLYINNRADLRQWLTKYSTIEKECWIIVKHGNPKTDNKIFWYLDAVEETLCFGWIDGKHKNIQGFGHAQKLSPRTKNSPWSELNKERVRRLEKLGLMTDLGRKVLPDMSKGSFVICDDIKNLLKNDKILSKNFYSFPPLYRRVRINAIQREKNKLDVYERMKKNFIEKTKHGEMYGLWNDYGRLLDY